MRKCFTCVFWGLILVVFDVSINGFDFLIDFVGYGLIAVGCRGLSFESPRFGTAGMFALALTAYRFVSDVTTMNHQTIISLMALLFRCLMMWNLLGGIKELSQEKGQVKFAIYAQVCRVVYCVFEVGSYLHLLVSAAGDFRTLHPLGALLIVAMLVLMVIIIWLVHRVKTVIAH